MKKIVIFVLLAVSLASCVYPFDPAMDSYVDDVLVVDGDIIIGETTSITVSRLSPLSKMLPADQLYPSVTVNVEQKDGSSYPGTCTTRGRYDINTTKADPSGTYRLCIHSLETGKVYVTPWQKALPGPMITSMFHSAGEESVAMCASIEGSEEVSHFRIGYTETWEYSADFRPDWMFVPYPDSGEDPEDPAAIYRKPYSYENYYYCWASLSNKEYVLATTEGLSSHRIEKLCYVTVPRTSKKLQIMYSALLSVRPISADAYAYFDNLKKNSNNSGNLFTPVPSDVRGNVVCESDTTENVIGYVSVCQNSSRRFFLDCEKEKLYKQTYDPNDLLFFPAVDEDGKYNFFTLYMSGMSPVFLQIRDDVPSKTNMYWAPARCTDCREYGGTKTKPSYWPNDHE